MEAGGYSLDLYCDVDATIVYDQTENRPRFFHIYDEFPHKFFAETGPECRSEARKKGWIFRQDGTHRCPRCSGKK